MRRQSATLTSSAYARRYSRMATLALPVGVIILLLFWLTRLNGLSSFPFFIDEGLHVFFSEMTLKVSPVAYANKYYLFSIWWWSVLGVPFGDPIWMSRAATVLAAVVGLGAAVGLGKLAAGLWGALSVGLVYLFSVYHMFFERLTLADPISAAAVLVAAYFGYRLSRRTSDLDAVLTGLAAFVAVGAKLSALPYLSIPVIAWVVFVLKRPGHARAQFRWLVIALFTEGLLISIYTGVLILIGSNPFQNAGDHVGMAAGLGAMLARGPRNLSNIVSDVEKLFGPVGEIGLLLSIVWLVAKQRFYLLLCILPAVFFLFSAMQSARYYAAPMSIIMVCIGVALADVARLRGRLPKLLVIAGLVVWALTRWLPFSWAMNNDPLNLRLSRDERHEYIESDATGFGLDEVATTLTDLQAERAIGMMANCQSLRYEVLGDIEVLCPGINPNGQSIPALRQMLEEHRTEGSYAVLEALPYVPDSAPGQVVATVDHPSGRPRLTIYRLQP